MLNQKLSEFKNRLKKSNSDPDKDMIFIHHALMKEYGWIPIKEFKELPIKTLWNLLDCIKKQHEEEEKRMNKGRRRSKR